VRGKVPHRRLRRRTARKELTQFGSKKSKERALGTRSRTLTLIGLTGKKNSDSSESNPNPNSKPKSVQLQKEKKEEGEEGKGLISPISNQNREKNQIGFNRTLTLTRDKEGEKSDSVQIEKKINQMKEMNQIEQNESG